MTAIMAGKQVPVAALPGMTAIRRANRSLVAALLGMTIVAANKRKGKNGATKSRHSSLFDYMISRHPRASGDLLPKPRTANLSYQLLTSLTVRIISPLLLCSVRVAV